MTTMDILKSVSQECGKPVDEILRQMDISSSSVDAWRKDGGGCTIKTLLKIFDAAEVDKVKLRFSEERGVSAKIDLDNAYHFGYSVERAICNSEFKSLYRFKLHHKYAGSAAIYQVCKGEVFEGCRVDYISGIIKSCGYNSIIFRRNKNGESNGKQKSGEIYESNVEGA